MVGLASSLGETGDPHQLANSFEETGNRSLLANSSEDTGLLTLWMYTRSPSQDFRVFGPRFWKILALIV